MRTRIVIEMCMGIDEYTDNTFLNKGIILPTNEAKHLLNSYTMFSEMYTSGEKITPPVARRMFELEAMDVRAGGSYMGIWQIFALSSVLNCNIISLYPKCGAALPRCILNRTIIPRKIVNRESGTKTALFLWTSTRSDMVMENWIPNHCVPLVSAVSQPESKYTLFDDEDLSISLEDSMLEHLLQSLNDEVITQSTHTRTDQDQSTAVVEGMPLAPESTDDTSPGDLSSIPVE
ncbi:vertnin-like [Pecten maximus]|uniref:vertnin-like n=1 Tax=Pecten maximus TaxID=6579 RepID=UPI001458FC00|nr:vertnin-like [Pecten maximus]